MTGEMWGRASGDGSGEEEEATQGAGAPKKKKKEGVRPDEGGDNDRRRGGEEAKCAMVCATPLHPSVCVVLISLFFGVCFFLLSRSPSLRIKQPAFRVES